MHDIFKLVLSLSLLQISIAFPTEAEERFDNYTVYRITPKTDYAVEILQDWHDKQNEFDFWLPVKGVGTPVDIMIPPKHNSIFEKLTDTEDMNIKRMIRNVQDLIDKENQKSVSTGVRSAGSLNLSGYHTLDEVGFLNLNNFEKVYNEVFIADL